MNTTSNYINTSNVQSLPSKVSSRKVINRIPNRITIQRRSCLFVLIRILLKYLQRVDPMLASRAQNVLHDCNKRNNLRKKLFVSGKGVYEKLVDTIERRMRLCVGVVHWKRAEEVCQKQTIDIGATINKIIREKKRKIREQLEQFDNQDNPQLMRPSKGIKQFERGYILSVRTGLNSNMYIAVFS
mmetsp:Transcript_20436/g.23452  ORF Transcript_20436/g.23452 Transcript_20436/m.23452 type:complete len:185 (-) Transcript_20436:648-1202(-)